MKIFLTGGTGFIGSHLVNQAHQLGHEIVALRRSPQSEARLPLEKEPLWLDKAMSELQPDDFTGCEVLIHLAAHSANVPYDTLENCLVKNVVEPITMFRAAAAAGLKRYLVAGTCFEYGAAGLRYDRIPLDAPLEPTSSYPASKAAATVAFQSLVRELEASMLMFRIFQVYGPGEADGRFWPSLRQAALRGEDFEMTAGDQVRDFIRVEDVAAAFLKASTEAQTPLGEVEIRHLASGKEQTLAHFAQTLWADFQASGQLKLGAKPQRANEVKRFVPA